MKTAYSQSLNNWFKDYPRTFRIVCGPNLAELAVPWPEGARVILTQTPSSMVVDGIYRTGVHLPDYKIIYSDTGSDSTFNLKYVEYGWGTFFKMDTAEPNYFLQVEKFCELHSGVNGIIKSFQNFKVFKTEIPKSTSLYGPVNPATPPEPVPQPISDYEAQWTEYYDVLPPDQDLGFWIVHLINAYGKYAKPPIPRSGCDTEVGIWTRATVTSHQISVRSTLFDSWFTVGSRTFLPYCFFRANSNWWRDLGISYFVAPDRYGIYCFYINIQLLGSGHDDYTVMETPIYGFIIEQVIWMGEDITTRLRESLQNTPGWPDPMAGCSGWIVGGEFIL